MCGLLWSWRGAGDRHNGNTMNVKIPFFRFEIKIHRVFDKPVKKESDIFKVNKTYDKIFCVGFNKTGTTSIGEFLKVSGLTLGNQAVAEVLGEDWAIYKRAERIIKYCHTADAFQDVPFMYPGLYKVLDKEFPNSKFILTVRDNAEQWYDSLVRFHTKLFSSDKSRTPDEEDKKNALYRYKGYIMDNSKYFWGYPQIPLYDETAYKKMYLEHNQSVREYFQKRPDDFIEVNVANQSDFSTLCKFLNIQTNRNQFPWENKT